MNMAIEIQRGYPEVEKRINGPQTVHGRLKEWSRARHYPAMNCWPPESPIYAVWKSPGRATDGALDGGMASMADRMGNLIAAHSRAVEVAKAVSTLPLNCKEVVHAMFMVEKMESPRTLATVAITLNVPKSEVQRRLHIAYGWLSRDLCIPPI